MVELPLAVNRKKEVRTYQGPTSDQIGEGIG
jgi:hypothetical protein